MYALCPIKYIYTLYIHIYTYMIYYVYHTFLFLILDTEKTYQSINNGLLRSGGISVNHLFPYKSSNFLQKQCDNLIY